MRAGKQMRAVGRFIWLSNCTGILWHICRIGLHQCVAERVCVERTQDTWADKLAMCKFDLLKLFINFVFKHGILNSVAPSNRDHTQIRGSSHNSIASLLSAIAH